MATVNRRFLTRHWILSRRCCSNRAVVSPTKLQLTFFSSKYRSCSNQPITWLHNFVTIFAIIAVMSTCRDITCESIPGSPPPFLFFFGARGEPGRKAKLGQLFCYYTGAVKHFDYTAQRVCALRNGVHYLKSGYLPN